MIRLLSVNPMKDVWRDMGKLNEQMLSL
jgi:hypothetical protein